MLETDERKRKLIKQHEDNFRKSTLSERQAAAHFIEHFADGTFIDDVDQLRKERIYQR